MAVFHKLCLLCVCLLLLTAEAFAAPRKAVVETSLGEEIVGPLVVRAKYFKPIRMYPEGLGGLPIAQSDIHVQADIHATDTNKLGYGAGDFVPYLTVTYRVEKKGGAVLEGNFMPMNAGDGPHYGNNVKLDGPGDYTITLFIENPEKQSYLLHVDRETGVKGRFWKEPLKVSWNFTFAPQR